VLRVSLVFLARHRRLHTALLAMLIALPLLGGGWLWLRGSSLVAVEHVHVTGVHGANAANVEAALRDAAGRMTTLDVHAGALRAAVAPWRVVRDLKVSPEFPHGLRIAVNEQLPVAALSVAGTRTAVAADGVVLGPSLLSGALPIVGSASSVPPLTGGHVRDGALLSELAVLGAAPAPLAKLITRAYMGPEGVTVALHSRLAYFGDATRPHAKWFALARVLADPSSAGAWYVDVRVPDHPAAGFRAGAIPGGASGGPGSAAQESQSQLAALVAGLSSGLGGSASATSPNGAAAGTPPSGAAASSQSGATSGGEAGSGETGGEARGHEAAAQRESGSNPGSERASPPTEAGTGEGTPSG
jgi:cell division protein FtsQ